MINVLSSLHSESPIGLVVNEMRLFLFKRIRPSHYLYLYAYEHIVYLERVAHSQLLNELEMPTLDCLKGVKIYTKPSLLLYAILKLRYLCKLSL